MSGVQVGIDGTDHIAFYCPKCSTQMHTASVRTERVVTATSPKRYDKCTWVYLMCVNTGCSEHRDGNLSQRKFYWTENMEYCTYMANETDD